MQLTSRTDSQDVSLNYFENNELFKKRQKSQRGVKSSKKSLLAREKQDIDFNIVNPNASVIVIDDQIYMLQAAKYILIELGVPSDFAASGIIGLELIENRLKMMETDPTVQKIKLVFIDFDMPVINGCQTAQ